MSHGNRPTKSVVNQYLQSWELPNMFIVSGAVFPNSFRLQSYSYNRSLVLLGSR